jgi:hypothetical protein
LGQSEKQSDVQSPLSGAAFRFLSV